MFVYIIIKETVIKTKKLFGDWEQDYNVSEIKGIDKVFDSEDKAIKYISSIPESYSTLKDQIESTGKIYVEEAVSKREKKVTAYYISKKEVC